MYTCIVHYLYYTNMHTTYLQTDVQTSIHIRVYLPTAPGAVAGSQGLPSPLATSLALRLSLVTHGLQKVSPKLQTSSQQRNKDMVDGRNPAPPGMVETL